MVDVCKLIDEAQRYFIYGIAVLGQYCHDKIIESYGEDIIAGFIQTVPQQEYFCWKNREIPIGSLLRPQSLKSQMK